MVSYVKLTIYRYDTVKQKQVQGYNDINLEIFLKCGDVKEWKLFLIIIMYEDNATKTWLNQIKLKIRHVLISSSSENKHKLTQHPPPHQSN